MAVLVALLASLVLVVPRAAAQYRYRVVVIEPNDEAESAELRARLRGELAAAGFEVVVAVSEGPDVKAQTESIAGTLHPAAVFYLVPPPASDPTASRELWLSDRLLRRTFVLRFGAAQTAPEDTARVAVQAVEILKADLAELSVTRGPPHEPPAKPLPPPPVPPPPEVTLESRPLRVTVEPGVGVLSGSSGLGAVVTPVLRAGVSLPAEWEGGEPPHVDVRARVAALGGEAQVEAQEGEARVRQTLAGLELALRILPQSAVQPFFLVCADALGVHVAGKSQTASSHERQTWSVATGGGLGLWIQPFVHARARPDFAISLTGELEMAWVPTEIRIAQKRVAKVGAPTALVGAGLVGSF